MTAIEEQRAKLQYNLDKGKALLERNRLGQYSTPYPLAVQICRHIVDSVGKEIENFLEPSIGTGVFFSALSEHAKINNAVGYEIDPYYFKPTVELWQDYPLQLHNADFLRTAPQHDFSLIIANPPYSRHHHIAPEIKKELGAKIKKAFGLEVSGLAGLYVYFIILSTLWLKKEGYSCWLIPSEFLSVNYGTVLKKFLMTNVNLVSIHTFREEDVQFQDALVSSSILIFRNTPPDETPIRFSWGSDLERPEKELLIDRANLDVNGKWTEIVLGGGDMSRESALTIGSFFDVKRGIATGDNSFFIINRETLATYNIGLKNLVPVIPPPRKLDSNVYTRSMEKKNRLYLLASGIPMDEIQKKDLGLFRYLNYGVEQGVHMKSNCRHREPWYRCEQRDPAPILVSYMGRDNGSLPIRFILNQAGATATNSYLMLYPKKEYIHLFKDASFVKKVWELLSSISKETLLAHSRSYGGGLRKWEPKELASIPCPELDAIFKPIWPSVFDWA